MDNPPEGTTSGDIRRMSGDDLLDMDYFLNEDDIFATSLENCNPLSLFVRIITYLRNYSTVFCIQLSTFGFALSTMLP